MRKAVIILLAALLLSGCTINPQDSVPAPGSSQINYSGGSGSGSGAANAGNGTGSAQNGTQKLFTLEEVAKHGTKADCWMVIQGYVLDLSRYAAHPGGDTYVPYCGKDATQAFATRGGVGADHSEYAYQYAAGYVIGELGKPMAGHRAAGNATSGGGTGAAAGGSGPAGGNTTGATQGGGNASGSGDAGNQSTDAAPQLILTIEEVAKHSTANDCWMVIYGKVLNLTVFSSHPGGSAYVPFCGTEATTAFDTKGGRGNTHSGAAVADLAAFTIGELGKPQNRTIDAANVTIPRGGDDWDDYEEDDD